MKFLQGKFIKKLGGLNNENTLLNYYGNLYVLRVPSKDNNTNFSNEHIIINLLKNKDLSPKIIYHNKVSGIMLTEFFEGSSLSLSTFKSKEFIKALTKTLKSFHNIHIEKEIYFNPFLEIEKNISYLKMVNFPFHHNIDIFLKRSKTIESKYKNNSHLGLCHNDLNTSNILYKRKKAYLIDLEFSGISDIYFDLATLSWFLSKEERCFLLKEYFPLDDLESSLQKLEDFLYIVKLWNATWSFKKSLTSTTIYDYKMGGNLILDSLF